MKSMNRWAVLAGTAAVSAAMIACGGGAPAENGSTAAPAANVQINGAGATFPYPIYSKWFDEYGKKNPGVNINYQSVGSGAGVRQVTAETVFFGASDQPMTDEQLKAAPGKVLHFPTVLGAVVPVYNVQGVTSDLNFSGQVLADIFLGKIKKWNDPQIAKINAGVKLPATDITVVHRSDGSGTSYIWADFLAKVSPEWKDKVGVNSALNWPTGIGGKGNEGVTGSVRQTPGSIGYVELIYALQNKLAYGAVQNANGEFLKASVEAVTAAAAGAAANMPADFRVSITNAPGAGAYPISSFTWLLLYEDPKDKAQSKIMVEFVKWALGEGQGMATALGYAPLPAEVVKQELALLATVKTQ